MRAIFVLAVVAMAFLPAPASAQMSAADVLKKVQGDKAELDALDAMLRDPDANTRITAMSAMISSGNPVLVRRARQAGLTSSDPDMRATALKAVFDAGGPFRVVLDLSKADEKTTRVREWLSGAGETASADGQSASFLLSADAYDPDAKCWKAPNSSYCAIVLAGETITLPTLRRAVASLTLGDDGVFRGTLATQLGSNAMPPVPASIDILE